ncbi:MAG: hypothetical protein WCH07_01955 [Deltaproteobacteria bacterium]
MNFVVSIRQQIKATIPPPLTNIEEVKTWYQYPFILEKWSQKGHKIYADAVAKVLRERQ